MHAAAFVIVAAVLGWSPGSSASAQPQGAPVAPGRASLEVAGATRVEYDDATRQWVFQGPRVVVTRGTLRIEAAEVRYNEPAREVTLPRGGAAITPTFEVAADRLIANLQNRHVTAEGHVAGRFLDEAAPATWGTFRAGHVEIDDRAELRRITATGDVVVLRENRRLSGDRVLYDLLAQQGAVDGHAEMVRGSDRLRADHVFADLARHEGTADDHVLLDRDDMHGSADHAMYSEAMQVAVLVGNVTVLRGRDTLKADRVTVQLDRRTAVAEGHAEFVANGLGNPPVGDPAVKP